MRRRRNEQVDTLPPHALPSPRRSLQIKVVFAALAFVAVPTGLCGYLSSRLAHHALEEVSRRDTQVLAEAAARMAYNHLEHGRFARIGPALDELAFDDRVAFVVVSDDRGGDVARRIIRPESWRAYHDQIPPHERDLALYVNRTMKLTGEGGMEMYVCRHPIWSRPRTGVEAVADAVTNPPGFPEREPLIIPADDTESSSAGAAPRKLHGYVTLGLYDPNTATVNANLQATTIAVVCVICLLSLPVVVWVVGRWTKPLRRMLIASLRLGAGWAPKPVEVDRDDEIGLLAQAFNSMAESLSLSQQRLRRANEQLEQKVAERTEQLLKANNRLQAEMRDKDEFVRAVSHDLNAPLRNIAGMTRMLLTKHREEMEEDMVAKLERISANAKAETELLNDLLELSRLKSRPAKRAEVELNAMMSQLVDSLGFEVEEKGITLVVDSDLPPTWGDRNRVRQVFQNLIDNAIKYMPADAETKEIHVGCEELRGELVYYVRDTGAGIAEEDQQEIFILFQRARYSGTSEIGGRGVGLATVKTIVEVHGGRIWVESEVGDGAKFCFTLGEAEPDESAPPTAAGGAPG